MYASIIHTERDMGRRSLDGLMQLYERNYRRLGRLLGDLSQLSGPAVSSVSDELDLHLRVLERSRFTTTIALTYYFRDERGEQAPHPDLQVRLYHDAGVAEAMSCRDRIGLYRLPPQDVVKLPVLAWKWELNLFLDKWLDYTLQQGHSFVPARGNVPICPEPAAGGK